VFRTVGGQTSLFQSVLPVELLRLPDELATFVQAKSSRRGLPGQGRSDVGCSTLPRQAPSAPRCVDEGRRDGLGDSVIWAWSFGEWQRSDRRGALRPGNAVLCPVVK
jgi:hypothetical protein